MVARKLKNVDMNEVAKTTNDNLASSVSQVEAMATPLWGGHFNANANKIAEKVASTSNFDKRFYAIAVESIKAHLKMSVKRVLIPEIQGKSLIEALDKIKKEIAEGNFTFDSKAKNIYENIYSRVKSLTGEAAEYMNVGRSASSQSVGDFKLWVRDAYDSVEAALQNLQAALIDKAEENVKAIFPISAHGQLTQPTSFGHYLMAYVEMFARDRSRIRDGRKRMNESPFASGEAVGNLFNMSREMVSRTLGFDKACSNSVDAINDRDFAFDFVSQAALCGIHLSRLAEDMINWHSSQNEYISFSNEFVAQSNVLPYRRDAEALGAIRGKASKTLGALVSVGTAIKGLSLEFTNDYNEICDSVIDSYDVLINSINAMSALVANFSINRKKMKEAASHSFGTAIDLVDWLIQNAGLSLSDAQNKSRQIIEYAIHKGKKLSLLELEEIQAFEPKATNDIYSALIPSRAMIGRRSGNGSNPVQIRKNIRAAKRNHL